MSITESVSTFCQSSDKRHCLRGECMIKGYVKLLSQEIRDASIINICKKGAGFQCNKGWLPSETGAAFRFAVEDSGPRAWIRFRVRHSSRDGAGAVIAPETPQEYRYFLSLFAEKEKPDKRS